jgi:hypothetical protein
MYTGLTGFTGRSFYTFHRRAHKKRPSSWTQTNVSTAGPTQSTRQMKGKEAVFPIATFTSFIGRAQGST